MKALSFKENARTCIYSLETKISACFVYKTGDVLMPRCQGYQ